MQALDLVNYATFIELPGSASSSPRDFLRRDLFDDGAQLLDACEKTGLSIGGVMRLREEHMTSPERARAGMARVVEVMREETTVPLAHPSARSAAF